MLQKFFFFEILLICSFFLFGCDEDIHYAPVTDLHSDPIPKSGTHRVVQGETLYEIAWRYGLDYRYLAVRNNIKSPYSIHVGQIIYVNHPPSNIVPKAKIQRYFDKEIQSSTSNHLPSVQFVRINPSYPDVIKPKSIKPIKPMSEETLPKIVQPRWIRPARGKTVQFFSYAHKGVSIAGREGDPIYAAASGKVVYCGSGLHGYGHLIILKHNSLYLSAYAHNRAVFVREGQEVKQGQKIAEMGHTGTYRVMLYFEIRRAGIPINPIKVLNS